jgi:carboxypeptidase family protein
MSRKRVACVCVALFASVVLSGHASAQQASGIAGSIKDTSGAVVPGVSVEASSPSLIEKVRAVVSDGDGRYNIVDLRPGTYTVTFSLPGFNTLKREGIQLSAGFTATVNADMQVGSLEETVTVTGASPLVDTQNVKQQTIVTDELIAALPSGAKGYMSVARLIPGMSGGVDSGGAAGIYASNHVHSATIHGKAGAKMSYDGMQIANLAIGGNLSYVVNPATVEETAVESGGVSAESNASGVMMNLVPKEGSNNFHLNVDGTFTNDNFQSNNLTDRFRSRGLTTTKHVLNLYDITDALGGPVKRDKVWFLVASRFSGNKTDKPGIYFNKTRGTPFYTPDLDHVAYNKEWLKSQAGRVTWQASPKNKISGFVDIQSYQVRGQGGNAAPESDAAWSFWPATLYQVSWSSPLTNKILLEAGAGYNQNGFPYTREQATDIFGFTVAPTDIAIIESSTGLVYNAKTNYYDKNQQDRYLERFSMSYVTGSHAFKTGVQLEQHVFNQQYVVNQSQQWTFLRGAPTSITQWAQPLLYQARTKADLGLYAQDKWAIKRLTVNAGVRFDWFNAYVPATHLDAGSVIGARDFAKVPDVPNWKDLNPRFGVSYDLFGDGRTALKSSLGRYVGKMATVVALVSNPVTTSVNNVSRSWNDANANYTPDCNLAVPDGNGECGQISNLNFGRLNPSAITYSDDLIRGWGTRDYFWDYSAEVQHQVSSRISVTGGYYRNWSSHYGTDSLTALGSAVFDNQSQGPSDFQPYCITAPTDSRLPGGGGYPICGLYDVVPSKFGQGQFVATRPSSYGDGRSKYSDFFTGSVTTRFGAGIELGGSLDTGRTVEDQCFVVDSPGITNLIQAGGVLGTTPVFGPNTETTINGERLCRTVTPFAGQTQVKVFGSYPFKYGFVASAAFQNTSGAGYAAYLSVPNSAIAPSLGRNLAACGTAVVCNASVTLPLIPPNTYFEPRRTLLDLRLSKIFNLGGSRHLRANLDIYNVLNGADAIGVNNTYGATWLRPTGNAAMTIGRLLQFGGQLTF